MEVAINIPVEGGNIKVWAETSEKPEKPEKHFDYPEVFFDYKGDGDVLGGTIPVNEHGADGQKIVKLLSWVHSLNPTANLNDVAGSVKDAAVLVCSITTYKNNFGKIGQWIPLP